MSAERRFTVPYPANHRVPVDRQVEDLCLFACYLRDDYPRRLEALTDDKLAEIANAWWEQQHGEND
jgi:hypothetical protein